MFKSEFYKIKKNKLRKVVILLMFTMALFTFFMTYYSSFDHTMGILHFFDIPYSERFSPVWASFLTSSAPGHIGYTLLIWFLPIYFLIINSDSYITEKNLGLASAIHTRMGNKQFLMQRFGFAFIIALIIFGGILVIDFVLANLVFNKGTDFSGMQNYMSDMPSISQFVYHNPTVGYIFYMITSCLAVAFYNIVIVALSLNIRKKALLYVISILLWFVMFTTPYNMSNLMQPLTEYGLEKMIPFACIYVILCFAIIIVSTWRFLKNDKI